jgi:hypothetical protein
MTMEEYSLRKFTKWSIKRSFQTYSYWTPETLIGYIIRRNQIWIVHYPGITETKPEEDTINGMVYSVSQQVLHKWICTKVTLQTRGEIHLQSDQKLGHIVPLSKNFEIKTTEFKTKWNKKKHSNEQNKSKLQETKKRYFPFYFRRDI